MSVLFVITVLFVLMVGLGTTIRLTDLKVILTHPKSFLLGLSSQILLLPALAFFLCHLFALPPHFSVGVMLIACCAGGASSNVISLLLGGNILLSATLTVFSSLISIFSLPWVMGKVLIYFLGEETSLVLPMFKTIAQLTVTIILPMGIGIFLRKWPKISTKVGRGVKRISLPLLVLMIAIFIGEQRVILGAHFFDLLAILLTLIVLSSSLTYLIASFMNCLSIDKRTLAVEVGIQNAAQAISIAVSPLLLNDPSLAIPAIDYAVIMNIIFFVLIFLFKFIRPRMI